MTPQTQEIKHFFYSQQFSDGFRMTIAILLPALISIYFNLFELGFSISLGTLCVSLTDAPGPIRHRLNGMLYCTLFIFLTFLITAFVRVNPYLLGLEILTFSFLFSMFSVYGSRAAGVGSAAILIMILNMDREFSFTQIWEHSIYIAVGGMWYMQISTVFYRARPYRPAQRALGSCIREIARYLELKADFYDVRTDLQDDYRKLLSQQVVVNEKLDVVRELFFKTRLIIKESTFTSKKLIVAFVESVDLFEDITATYYDYSSLRNRFDQTVILDTISRVIREISYELDRIGLAIGSNTSYKSQLDFDQIIIQLKEQVDELEKLDSEEHTLILKKILVNVRKILQRIRDINRYFEATEFNPKNKIDYSRFISHQSFDPKLLWNNLNLQSLTFKHSLRVAIASTAGFIVAKSFFSGQYSYWILLTIAFIIKPGFSLTRQRNYERITGTLLGGLIAVLILYLIQNNNLRFVFLFLAMLGAYSFLRTRYFAMVVFVTVYIILLFNFLGIPFASVARERIIDTIIGGAIAFSASYFLFPAWESEQIKGHMRNILVSNATYLEEVVLILSGQRLNILNYKLARKDVYVHSANLNAAFDRMLSEPKSTQRNNKLIQQFVVLNHVLFSNIATVSTSVLSQKAGKYSGDMVQLTKKCLSYLNESVQKLDPDFSPLAKSRDVLPSGEFIEENSDTLLLKEQLRFMSRISADILRLTKIIASS